MSCSLYTGLQDLGQAPLVTVRVWATLLLPLLVCSAPFASKTWLTADVCMGLEDLQVQMSCGREHFCDIVIIVMESAIICTI